MTSNWHGAEWWLVMASSAGHDVGSTARQGFHEGELAVQRRAGVRDEASRLAGMLTAPNLDGGMARFLADRDLIMITARDEHGELWTSPIHGAPGFCSAHGDTLVISALPGPGDPLHGIGRGRQVGLLAVDFGRRRRLRVNGVVTHSGPDGIEIAVDQAFGNCPRYIRQRGETLGPGAVASSVERHRELTPDDIALIGRADTLILGTTHPASGVDTSHRGGAPGFVRVDDGTLWWPDYPGNNLFNSLGNIVADPAVALLFLDLAAGRALQITGAATLEWVPPGGPGDDGGTGRRVRVTPNGVIGTSLAVHTTG